MKQLSKLRLVERYLSAPSIVGDGEQLMLFSETKPQEFIGLVDVSRLSEMQFVEMLRLYQPRVVFDARTVPYLNIGRLHRSDVFRLFSSIGTVYLYASSQNAEGDVIDNVPPLLLREWNDENVNRGVVLIFLHENVDLNLLRSAIRQRFLSREFVPPKIRVLSE